MHRTAATLGQPPPTGPRPGEPPGRFLNVYLRKADPARGGFYQGDLSLMEVHLKQEGIDPTGWAFYGYGREAEAAEKIPPEAACYTCHAQDAGYDNVFVQFYPKIRERLGLEAPPEESD